MAPFVTYKEVLLLCGLTMGIISELWKTSSFLKIFHFIIHNLIPSYYSKVFFNARHFGKNNKNIFTVLAMYKENDITISIVVVTFKL